MDTDILFYSPQFLDALKSLPDYCTFFHNTVVFITMKELSSSSSPGLPLRMLGSCCVVTHSPPIWSSFLPHSSSESYFHLPLLKFVYSLSTRRVLVLRSQLHISFDTLDLLKGPRFTTAFQFIPIDILTNFFLF